MPLLALVLAPVLALFAGAVAAVAARVQGGSRGILCYVLLPITLLLWSCIAIGGVTGGLAGLAAVMFAAGSRAGGFTPRPLLVRLRLATPAAPSTCWS